MRTWFARPRTSANRRVTAAVAFLVVVAVSFLWPGPLSPGPASAAASSPTTYQDYVYPSGTGADGPTADKPQSKLWYKGGSWWALMVPQGGSGVHIQKLASDHTWTDTGVVVDARTDATSDAQSNGDSLFVVSRTAGGDITVNSFTYNGGGYRRVGGYPKTVGTGGTESASLDQDTTGALWVVWTKSKKVLYSRSDAGRGTFTAAAALPVPDPTVFSDDIASVIAFRGKIGVLWSDHATGPAEDTTTSYMRFATHNDGTGDSTASWSVENIQTGTYSSDDHINLKTWSEDPASGTVYAAFKTSYEDQSKTDTSKPQIIVAARHVDGSVDKVTAADVGTGLTRPQLLIDSSARLLYVFMTTSTAGTVYAKQAPIGNIAFTGSYNTANSGRGTPFVTYSGARINNVSVSKDPVTSTTGIVALASDTAAKTYYHAEQGLKPGSAQIRRTGVVVRRPGSTLGALPNVARGRVGKVVGRSLKVAPALQNATVLLQGRSRAGTAWQQVGHARIGVTGAYRLVRHHRGLRGIHQLRVVLPAHGPFGASSHRVPAPPISDCRITVRASRFTAVCSTTASEGTKVRLLHSGHVVKRTTVRNDHVRVSGTGRAIRHILVVDASRTVHYRLTL